MRRKKLVSTLATFAVAAILATDLQANPQPGPGQETYMTYYSDASLSNVVGVQLIGIGIGGSCQVHHTSWGARTPYHTVTVAACGDVGGAN